MVGKVRWQVTMSLDGFIAGSGDAADGKDVVLIGASIGRQRVEHGLADDILIHLAPVLLGDGVRLYHKPGGEPVRLERIGLGQSGDVTDLCFRLAGTHTD
jgi:dihydrofolate reductase